MSKCIRNPFIIFFSTVLWIGCTPTTNKDESAGENGETNNETTIYDIQMNNFEEGTMVTINDAIVTSTIIPGDYPGFFIQSEEGGEYNGLYIFMYDEVAEEYQPSIGDIINITGEYTEFYQNSQLRVTVPGSISITGTGGEVIVTELTEEPDSWEPYESVMVKFSNAEIIDASKLYEWGAVQLGIGCWMDNVFTDYEAETCSGYESITGPMTYSFEKYSILPRSSDDLVGYIGAELNDSCETDCADGEDNDGDGYTDCEDPNCASDPECLEPEICNDSIDNDGDGFVDCDDWDCDDDPACEGSSSGSEDCSDGEDNDGDGFVDCDDWDCDDDPECGGSSSDSEDCSDGEDNDGDGYTDCIDHDCSDDAACAEDCSDGEDNDADGYTDCDDFYCDDDPACAK